MSDLGQHGLDAHQQKWAHRGMEAPCADVGWAAQCGKWVMPAADLGLTLMDAGRGRQAAQIRTISWTAMEASPRKGFMLLQEDMGGGRMQHVAALRMHETRAHFVRSIR